MKFVIIMIFGLCLALSQLTACATGNDPGSTLTVLSSPGSTESGYTSNDLAQMQKDISFTIILPQYLPDEFKTLPPQFVRHIDGNNQNILTIYYYSLTSAGQFWFDEYIPSKSLSQDILVKVNPDSTILDMDGIQILERKMIAEVIRNTQSIRGNKLSYIWMSNNVYILVDIFEIDQVESRKIIQSMIH